MFFLFLSLFAAITVILLVAERLWPATAQRVEWANNAVAFGLSTFANLIVAVFPAVLVTRLINAAGGGLIDLSVLPLALGAIVYLVAMDIGEYLFHRAQHAIPWMWAMHSLHHSDRGLNVTTTQRHFWLEPLLKSVTIWAAVALVFRVNSAILIAYSLVSLYHFLPHANLRLGFGRLSWLLNSPQYHRLHHSRDPRHYNTNFAALFPILDVLAGSYRRPARGEFPAAGLDVAATSPLEMVTWPAARLQRAERAEVGQGAAAL